MDTLASHTPGPVQTQTSLSVQGGSNFFPNAHSFNIMGGHFFAGNIYNHLTHTPEPSHTNAPRPANLLNETFSESEIYCKQLLRRKRGFPLYVPGPQQNSPPQYRAHGIAIGDVGRITPEGIFDFFFNIYLPANDPINNNRVPDDFVPLGHYDSGDVFDLIYDPGNHVSTSSIQRLDPECHAPQGAVLALPRGAHLQKLENLDAVREYAAAHAESWYKYINGPRGRRLTYGSLYLVTGCEKAQSWGMASFHSIGHEFQLDFKPTPGPHSTGPYKWSGNPAQKKRFDRSPINGASNQTTFIHGLSISLGTTLRARLFGTVEIREIVESQLASASRNSVSPTQESSFISRTLGFFGGGAATDGKQCARQNGNIVLSDSSPISEA
ncbi:hypothetical protein B0H19DRAFT_1341646 [Mycena capillaripes]|nr:hypothetical protein B0H19DRAFT_1341646 [Mycena capillaripes]